MSRSTEPGDDRLAVLDVGGLLNVRDLGGVRTEDGGAIRRRALVRSESPTWATGPVWEPLAAAGVRTVVDLRSEGEPTHEPPAGSPLAFAKVPLFGDVGFDDLVAMLAGSSDLTGFYVDVLDRFRDRFAAAADAVANAPEGGVLVHCNMGKDRTGLVVAVLLRAVGGRVDDICADFSHSASNLQARLAEWATQADEPERRRARARMVGGSAEDLRALLEHLDERLGGAAAYLRAAGASDADLRRLRLRLVDGGGATR